MRPLLTVWRDETEAYCRAEGLEFRVDSSNPGTRRGLIRAEVLPLLRQLHPAAERNILASLEAPAGLARPVERALADLVSSPAGSKRVDLGDGVVAVREYDEVWLERAPVALEGEVRWGGWVLESARPGLRVRGWRAGDHLAGRRKKVQDLFVDAKVPRSKRETWPLVVAGDDVVTVPGIAAAPGWEDAVSARRDCRVTVLPDELQAGVSEILIDEETLQRRIDELGATITEDYRGGDLLLVGVLKGAIFFMADLMRRIALPCEVDFMAISSYGSGVDSSGVVRILKDLDVPVEDRNVLIVEDIVDSGLTLSYLVRNIEARRPASVEICALLAKPERRENDVDCRYVGFEIPNRFVIGYGLDFAERYRNLPYIGVLRDDLIAQSEEH